MPPAVKPGSQGFDHQHEPMVATIARSEGEVLPGALLQTAMSDSRRCQSECG